MTGVTVSLIFKCVFTKCVGMRRCHGDIIVLQGSVLTADIITSSTVQCY